MKPDEAINLGDEGGDTLKTYGFTKLVMSGAYLDCANLGYLIGASIDTVIYRAKPFTSMVYAYKMRKKQVQNFTALFKLKIGDECNPTNIKWLATHDIYNWCDNLAIELVKEWIKEPYSL